QAAALPWPGSPEGVRYREGTDLLESAAGLLLVPPTEGLAVDPEGRVLASSADGLVATAVRAGPALAFLGEGLLAAASAAPPGSPDAIQLLARHDDDVEVVETLPVSGALRALAVRRYGPEVRAALVLGTRNGGQLQLMRLRRHAS